MAKIHKYSHEEKEFIRSYAHGHSYEEIAKAVNEKFNLDLSKKQIRWYLKNNGISTGITGRFEKGHIPDNKGKSMSAETYKKCSATMFQKGSMPKNHKPVGTISVRNNYKIGQKCVYEKVAEPNVWRMKHILEWEQHYGEVPKGKMVIFADGNPLNTDIGNLVLITRQQNAVMNRWGVHGIDRESTETAANIATLKIKISEKKKKAKGAKKNDTGNRIK